jgi:hypothetical protein
MDMTLTGQTINSYAYDGMLKELRKHFKPVRPHKNPAEMLLQHDKATHKFEDSGSHHKIWVDGVNPSTLQPQSSTFRSPLVSSRQGCYMQHKVSD